MLDDKLKNDNVLLLHIGLNKTGTTALQDFLYLNAEHLKKYGWCYPDLLKDWTGCFGGDYSEGEKNGRLLTVSQLNKWKTGPINCLFEIIRVYLEKYNVIISDEGIWSHPDINTEELLSECREHYPNIKAVVYLRRQDLYLESTWNQSVKKLLYTDPVGCFCDNSFYARASADYLKKLRAIAGIIGEENIIVRIYEKSQFEGAGAGTPDVISDFMNVLGNVNGCRIDLDEGFARPNIINERLVGDALWKKLIFNKEYAKHARIINPDVMKEFLKKNIDGDKKYGYLTREERIAVLERYKKDNSVVARDFLGRESGELFYDADFDQPVYVPDIPEDEADAIRAYARRSAKGIWKYRILFDAIFSKMTGRFVGFAKNPDFSNCLERIRNDLS